MKKLIPVLLAALLFSGCAARTYTPVINEDFKVSAIYKTGDFSFSCEIEKQGNTLYFTPTSTRAKGMVISCNGSEVTFKRNKLIKTFEASKLDKTNPAVLLQGIFTSLDAAGVNLIDGVFTYSGKCPLGSYVLKQAGDNRLLSLELPQAGIYLDFE